MLRLRLQYGLLTIILLLWGVGATALLLMQDTVTRLDKGLRTDYQAIDASQRIRTLASTLNVRYLPTLAGPGLDTSASPLDRGFHDQLKPQILQELQIIKTVEADSAQWRQVVSRLNEVINSYFKGYETFFANTAIIQRDREKLSYSMSFNTQRLVDNTENVIDLSEEKLFKEAKYLKGESGKNILFVGTLVTLGTLIAILIYNQLIRHLVEPVSKLHRSMQEIIHGNYEQAMTLPGEGSELIAVVESFNEMAAELKLHRSQSDDSLRRANMVNQAILEAIPSPVFVLGDDTGIVQINPAAEKLTESLGVTGRLPLKIRKILDDCRESQTHFLPEDPREAILFRIEEEEFFFLPRIFRFESPEVSQSGWAILLHNVSRIRWLDDMKTNLLSTVSHEIKTPLTGIRMVLHLLLEERSGSLDATQKIMVSSANDDCERLLVTLNTLLDLSRAESGATHLACVSMKLQDSVDRSVRLFESAAIKKGIKLNVINATENLPEINADPLRLDEVIHNLVSNAIKHSPEGGEIKIRLTKPNPEFLRVSVIDHGPGVPEGSQSRIFERFYRAPDQKSDGVGLGLFISREIMRAHEGRIGLRDRTDRLTEFYIDVPIA